MSFYVTAHKQGHWHVLITVCLRLIFFFYVCHDKCVFHCLSVLSWCALCVIQFVELKTFLRSDSYMKQAQPNLQTTLTLYVLGRFFWFNITHQPYQKIRPHDQGLTLQSHAIQKRFSNETIPMHIHKTGGEHDQSNPRGMWWLTSRMWMLLWRGLPKHTCRRGQCKGGGIVVRWSGL